MIVTNEALLRVKCEDVLPEEVEELRAKLDAELRRSFELGRPGIGLAAPQINIKKRIAIVRIPGEGGVSHNVDLVNCRIAQGHHEAYFVNEGCLSFPGKFVRTRRFKEIYVVENAVEPHSFIATELLAVCIQHELDHLRGVLLPDLEV